MTSKSHQAGTEMKKSATYATGLRVNNEWPFRVRTSASMVRQYPSHMGKNPQCVRSPVKDQFMIQKIMANNKPSLP
jgi:hypothetical protein